MCGPAIKPGRRPSGTNELTAGIKIPGYSERRRPGHIKTEAEVQVKTRLVKWSLILLCFSMAGAIGGGPLRTHRADSSLEPFPTLILLSDTTRHRSAPSALLDPGSRAITIFLL